LVAKRLWGTSVSTPPTTPPEGAVGAMRSTLFSRGKKVTEQVVVINNLFLCMCKNNVKYIENQQNQNLFRAKPERRPVSSQSVLHLEFQVLLPNLINSKSDLWYQYEWARSA